MTPQVRNQAGNSDVPVQQWKCSCGHQWAGPYPECPQEETDTEHDHEVEEDK